MALWGTSDADEAKPKYLTDAQKKQVYATSAGWVAEPGLSGNGNASAQPEVLVAIGANATALNSGTIKDAGTSTVSTITNLAAIGTAAGTITVS